MKDVVSKWKYTNFLETVSLLLNQYHVPSDIQLTNKLNCCRYKQIPVGKPGPEDVLVNIKFSGVCHTDLHALQGDWPLATKLPLVGGHEGAGIVVAKGELVKDVEIGDKVGIKVWFPLPLLDALLMFHAQQL